MLYYVSLGLTIVSCTLYHIIQKATPSDVHPIVSLIVTYASALVMTLLVYPFLPAKSGFMQSLQELNWTSYALGAAILGIEIGFLLAYRAGWNVSIGSAASTVTTSLLLIPLGMILFKETLTAYNILGLILCAIGLLLSNYKS